MPAQFLHSKKQAIYLSTNQRFLKIYSPGQDDNWVDVPLAQGMATGSKGGTRKRLAGLMDLISACYCLMKER